MDQGNESCIFCQIASGKSPAQIEFQDDQCVVFWDIQPAAATHLLVISKKHISSLAQTTGEDEALLGHMLGVVREVSRRKRLDSDGYRAVINTGLNAGQVVDHIHIHILAGQGLGPMATKPAVIAE